MTQTALPDCSSASVQIRPSVSGHCWAVKNWLVVPLIVGLPIGGVVHGEHRGLGLRRDRADAGDLILDRGDVVHVEIGRLRAAAAAAEALAGADLEDVGAEAGNLLGHRRGRALAQGHHRHHRGDADDDAEVVRKERSMCRLISRTARMMVVKNIRPAHRSPGEGRGP